jgi:hypothetical protein
MTAAQKAAKEKFSKAIAYRSKTGVSLKEAFAHVYGKKVGAVKKKAAPKKKAAVKKAVVKKAAPKKKAAAKKVTSSHKDTKSHNVNIRVVSGLGALPIDFKGSFLGYKFKIINQYQLDGSVTAQLVEIETGNIIASLSGSTKENDRTIAALYGGALSVAQIKSDKETEKKIKTFVVNLNKEVAAYNSGKDTTKKKSKGLKIVYKPQTKKLAIVDQIKSILKDNKKILKGGYTLKAGTIREKKIAGLDKDNVLNKINYSLQLEEMYQQQLDFLKQVPVKTVIEKKIKLDKQKMYFDLLKIEQNRIKELKKHIK